MPLPKNHEQQAVIDTQGALTTAETDLEAARSQIAPLQQDVEEKEEAYHETQVEYYRSNKTEAEVNAAKQALRDARVALEEQVDSIDARKEAVARLEKDLRAASEQAGVDLFDTYRSEAEARAQAVVDATVQLETALDDMVEIEKEAHSNEIQASADHAVGLNGASIGTSKTKRFDEFARAVRHQAQHESKVFLDTSNL